MLAPSTTIIYQSKFSDSQLPSLQSGMQEFIADWSILPLQALIIVGPSSSSDLHKEPCCIANSLLHLSALGLLKACLALTPDLSASTADAQTD